jgi:hypothetical protein
LAGPKEYIGDGQWPEGRVEFDFTANPAATQILIAPRINETADGQVTNQAADWLLDDFTCVERHLGPRGEVETFYQPQPIMTRDAANEIILQVSNSGDEPHPSSRARLILPEGLSVANGSPSDGTFPIF